MTFQTTNWSDVVNFHCRQMSFVMSTRFIFGDDLNDALCSSPLLDFRALTHAF